MHSTTVLAAALGLATAAIASPLKARQSPDYWVPTVQSSMDVFDAQVLSASGGSFRIGKPINTTCTVNPSSICENFPNITAISLSEGSSITSAGMAADVPAGQDIFVSPTGLLSFTEPHLEGVYPTGSYTEGFLLTHEDDTTMFVFYNASSTGWAVCGDEPPVQVYAQIPAASSACGSTLNPIDIVITSISTVGAYQYE